MLTFLSKLYPFKYPFSSCRKYQLRIRFFIKGIISLLKIFLSYLSSILSNTSSKPEFLEQKLLATRNRILSTSCQNLWWIFENPYLESINLEVFLFYFLNYTYCLTVDIKPKETNSSLIPIASWTPSSLWNILWGHSDRSDPCKPCASTIVTHLTLRPSLWEFYLVQIRVLDTRNHWNIELNILQLLKKLQLDSITCGLAMPLAAFFPHCGLHSFWETAIKIELSRAVPSQQSSQQRREPFSEELRSAAEVKGMRSGTNQLPSQLRHLLGTWPRASYLISFCLSLLIFKPGIVASPPQRIVMRAKWIVDVKDSQHYTHTVSIVCYYDSSINELTINVGSYHSLLCPIIDC